MTLGLLPHPLWHFLAIIPPIILWRLYMSQAKHRHIIQWHNAILAVSFWEEVLFRGLIYGLIVWLSKSTITTIVLSSLLFGLLHLRNLWWASKEQVMIMCVTMMAVYGPIFGLIRYWSGDIYLCILAHYLNNFVSMQLANNKPTDEYLVSKQNNMNWFERLFAGDWLATRTMKHEEIMK